MMNDENFTTEFTSNESDALRKRSYRMVLNNYTDFEVGRMGSFHQLNGVNVLYWCYGKEIAPTTGTPHLQGYIQLKNPKTMKELHVMISRHLGVPSRWAFKVADAKPAANRKYCMKDGDFVEFGVVPKGQGKRTDLDVVGDLVCNGASMEDLVQNHFASVVKYHKGISFAMNLLKGSHRDSKNMTIGYWLHGPTGCGKSRWAHKYGEAVGGLYVKDPMTKWFDGYQFEKVCLIDDYRANKELPFSMLLRLVDRYKMSVEMKGSSMPFNSNVVIVTCPLSIEACFAHLEFMKEGDIAQMKRRFREFDMSDPNTLLNYLDPLVPVRVPPLPSLPLELPGLTQLSQQRNSSQRRGLIPNPPVMERATSRVIESGIIPQSLFGASRLGSSVLNPDEEFAQMEDFPLFTNDIFDPDSICFDISEEESRRSDDEDDLLLEEE